MSKNKTIIDWCHEVCPVHQPIPNTVEIVDRQTMTYKFFIKRTFPNLYQLSPDLQHRPKCPDNSAELKTRKKLIYR
jgi:hypothetical protein